MEPLTNWKEEIAPNEAEQLEALAKRFTAHQSKFVRDGKLPRAAHNKGTLGVKATFTVLPDLPAHARVGIFAAPATYEAWVRYSNAALGHESDHKPDIRGIAIKLLGVPGKKIIPGMDSARTQDFLMITSPQFGFRNADEFIFFALAASNPLTLIPKAIARLGFGRTIGIIKSFVATGKPFWSVAEQRFFSQAPTKWGAYAAKVSVIPVVPVTTGKPLPKSPDYLREELIDRLSKGSVEYDFAAQFYVDAAKTPIEDLTVAWPEADAPFVKLARLTIPQQDLRSEAGKKQIEYVESLSFDPWHAPVDFQPLGNIMRARNNAYRLSTIARGATKEPEGPAAVVP